MVSIGDDFWIENEHGQKVYKIDGKALRVRQTLIFEDAQGHELCKIQERMLRIKHYDWDLVQTKITYKTKAIIINSPHNPTGSLITEEDIKELERITSGTDILIISDEVYEHITFDGKKHISVASSEELAIRTFVISSFGKTYHTTGWKMGYCVASEYLTKEFRKMHQFIVFSVNTPIQYAYAEFMKHEERYLSLSNFYQHKRDVFVNAIKNSKPASPARRLNLKNCDGTYFQLLDYSAISDKPDMEFSEYLTKEIGVAVIPLSGDGRGRRAPHRRDGGWARASPRRRPTSSPRFCCRKETGHDEPDHLGTGHTRAGRPAADVGPRGRRRPALRAGGRG